MDFATFFAVMAASLPITITIIVVVAKFSGSMGVRLGGIEVGISNVTRDVGQGRDMMDQTLKLLTTHTKDCDAHHVEHDLITKQQDETLKKQSKKLEKQGDQLNDHGNRITGLEKA